MKSAYDTSGKIFQQVSMRYQPGLLEQLQSIDKQDIIVVQGTYDHVEKLLDTIKVPYTMISPDSISSHNGGRVMFVNCRSYDGSLAKKTKDVVTNFVEEGGRLITTDWSLGFVNKIFPGKFNHTTNTSDDVVEIKCPTDLGRKFIGMNYAQCRPKWWLEGSSHIYSVGEGVTPIITSDEMSSKYGQGTVVAGFTKEKGEVFHFISHLELQRTQLRSKEDKGSLDEFLKKMQVEKTAEMDDATVAELEAAYSTLNTVAYLCLSAPLLTESMNSISLKPKPSDALKSMRLV